MAHNLRVAYILHRFPYLTETFIMREMYWLRAQGVEIEIFSLLPPKHALVHKEAKALLTHAHYSSFLSWLVLKAQFHFLWRSPARYGRALAKIIWHTYREPGILLRILALFPKSVYFAQKIAKLEIDHIHTHFVWLDGLAAGVVADLIDITFSIHPHAFGLFSRVQENVRRELENASQVVAVSSYHRDYIDALCPQISPDDIEIVYYGVDTDRFQPPARSSAWEPIRILSVGRLIEKKGHEYLIEACALLVERGIPFQCQIVGAGPLQQTLQSCIDRHKLQDRVILLGALGQDQILELYQTSDIFTLACVLARSGDQDGMPNTLIEAMACARPIVTTPVSGITDLVLNNKNGLLVQERDVSGLADALERLILDEKLRQQLGKQAHQTILQSFQIQHATAKLAAIFRQVSKRYQNKESSTTIRSHYHEFF